MSRNVYGIDIYREVLREFEKYGRPATTLEAEVIKATCLIVARLLRNGGGRA